MISRDELTDRRDRDPGCPTILGGGTAHPRFECPLEGGLGLIADSLCHGASLQSGLTELIGSDRHVNVNQ